MLEKVTWFVYDDDFHLNGFLTEMILQRARVQTTVSALDLGHDQFSKAILEIDLRVAIGLDVLAALGERDLRKWRADEWNGDSQILASANDDLFRAVAVEANGMRSDVRCTSLNSSVGLC